jgi:anaphase-promoting complex subunit 3
MTTVAANFLPEQMDEANLSPVEQSFASLIQQYLGLFLHSNATFLAERFTAHSPSSPYAAYLLAICHYRSHSPKRARSVLLPFKHEQGSLSDCILYLLAKCCVDLSLWNEAEEYLLQKARADYAAYKRQRKKQLKDANSAGVEMYENQEKDHAMMESLESWLEGLDHKTDPSSPVPQGAAGYHLLGLICKRTVRVNKAICYFKLSLKLDPMLWMSYHELCEMGAALSWTGVDTAGTWTVATGGEFKYNDNYGDGDDDVMQDENDDTCEYAGVIPSHGIDPASIFGAIPPSLLNIPRSMGGYGEERSKETMKVDTTSAKEETIRGAHDTEHYELIQRARATHAAAGIRVDKSPFALSNSPIAALGEDDVSRVYRGGNRASSAMGGFDGTFAEEEESMDVGGTGGKLSFVGGGTMGATPMIGKFMGGVTPGMDQSALRGTSLFQGNLSTIRKMDGLDNTVGARRSSTTGLPSTALFGSPREDQSTLNLTFLRTPRNAEEEMNVLQRAKDIVGRRYYEPSPESTPPNRIKIQSVPHPSLKLSRKKSMRRLVDSENDAFQSRNEHRDVHREVDGNEKKFLFDTTMDITSASPGFEVKDSAVKIAKSTSRKLTKVKEDESKHDNTDDSAAVKRREIAQRTEESEKEGVKYILQLLCTFGAAQRLLCAFKCKESIQILHTLPHNQFQTGWVQHQLGRAYFYSVDYINAQRALESMQEVEPHRMNGLELLSTTLYLLKKEVELSNLAQRCIEFDRMSPETWCVVGNCFSLQKEHKTALSFFRRSIQLDPDFTYAHTLSGHEYVANEDFDHAIASFRNAIRIDDRHYNAWNGLGEIYFRQEKYGMAEYHFQKALSINPQGSVIRCNLGQAQHANGKHGLALKTLALVDQRNPQAQFQRANILISLGRLNEALRELEKVRDAAPREATIHFAMGRVLKKLGKPDLAMRCFLTALDLDPKENSMIKSAIDRLDDVDVEEDVSVF